MRPVDGHAGHSDPGIGQRLRGGVVKAGPTVQELVPEHARLLGAAQSLGELFGEEM